MAHYGSVFSINRLRVEALIGLHAYEHTKRQPVDICVRLYFSEPPAATGDDNAAVLDYSAIAERLSALATKQHYRLIEYLAQQLFDAVRAYADAHGGQAVKLWVRLTKVSPAVPFLREGASLVLSDLPAGATTVPVE